jgi:hypothetical protein
MNLRYHAKSDLMVIDNQTASNQSFHIQPKRTLSKGRLALIAACVTLSAAAVGSSVAFAHSRWQHTWQDTTGQTEVNPTVTTTQDSSTTSDRKRSRRAWRRGTSTVPTVDLLESSGASGSGSGATSDGGTVVVSDGGAVAANQVPIAAFTYAASGSGYTFNASGSYDNDGQIDNYVWDFGDGSRSQGTQLTSHTYTADGTYDVMLTVTDDGGLTSTLTQPVVVNSISTNSNVPPDAQFIMNTSSGVAPLTVTFDASSSSDDGQIANYQWNFGDGGAPASGRTAMHVYNQTGNFNVTLSVTDDGGLSASTAKPVVVTAATAAPPSGAIWQPTPGTSWQWQLTGAIDTSFNVQMYDIDLFDTPKSTIDALHGQGRVVICYFSAGSWEDWRPDAAKFPANVKGNGNGWPGEKWLDIRNIAALTPIMTARLDLAVDKGCDGVEPDNVDGYSNNTGFPLTGNDQLTYNRWLADQAHARGLSVGLKNDVDQAAKLEPYFNWALNEQCFQYNECDQLLPFVQAGKAVFGVEYSGSLDSFCPEANSMDFDWLKKNENLNASREACR